MDILPKELVAIVDDYLNYPLGTVIRKIVILINSDQMNNCIIEAITFKHYMSIHTTHPENYGTIIRYIKPQLHRFSRSPCFFFAWAKKIDSLNSMGSLPYPILLSRHSDLIS